MWRDKVACAGLDRDLFFTESLTTDAINRLQPIAEQHCRGCPAIHACAVFADTHREWGLWGGSYRFQHGSYQRRPLIDGAPLYELPPRLAGAGAGAWAS